MTTSVKPHIVNNLYFNSHPHEEDDIYHTSRTNSLSYFNSHPHEEDDNGDALIISTIVYFNSHPHEEDDVGRTISLCTYSHFNSHPHEEDDPIALKDAGISFISTHILTKRMTSSNSNCTTAPSFQLTSSRRG